jgi:hypothetical protein
MTEDERNERVWNTRTTEFAATPRSPTSPCRVSPPPSQTTILAPLQRPYHECQDSAEKQQKTPPMSPIHLIAGKETPCQECSIPAVIHAVAKCLALQQERLHDSKTTHRRMTHAYAP